MKKRTSYEGIRFSPDTIKSARDLILSISKDDKPYLTLKTIIENSTWDFDSENEFFAAIRSSEKSYDYTWSSTIESLSLDVEFEKFHNAATVRIKAPTKDFIEQVSEIFEKAKTIEKTQFDNNSPKKYKIFIGHGHAPDWRLLKEHLQEKHQFEVESYETGSRSGHAVKDILNEMLNKSSVAFLVMTGEDETLDSVRARQNVIHEIGLFQGKLGFNKAIVLMERGVEQFSNIHGLEYIPFDKGSINQTYGDVVAVINRETKKKKN